MLTESPYQLSLKRPIEPLSVYLGCMLRVGGGEGLLYAIDISPIDFDIDCAVPIYLRVFWNMLPCRKLLDFKVLKWYLVNGWLCICSQWVQEFKWGQRCATQATVLMIYIFDVFIRGCPCVYKKNYTVPAWASAMSVSLIVSQFACIFYSSLGTSMDNIWILSVVLFGLLCCCIIVLLNCAAIFL